MRAAMSRTRVGAVTSQGDFVQQSAAVRTSTSLTGAGITVGVLSDSFDCYAVYAKAGSGVPASGYAGYAPMDSPPPRPTMWPRAICPRMSTCSRRRRA